MSAVELIAIFNIAACAYSVRAVGLLHGQNVSVGADVFGLCLGASTPAGLHLAAQKYFLLRWRSSK
jgi:hypothetical protein